MIQNILSFFKEKENDLDTKKKKQKHDPSFLAAIQPQGGVSFPERYIKKGMVMKQLSIFTIIQPKQRTFGWPILSI